MSGNDLWKYCTAEQERDMLISFRLLDGIRVKEGKYLACLYALSNHADEHYHAAAVKKRGGGVRSLMVPDALLGAVQRNILHHILDGITPVSYTHLR